MWVAKQSAGNPKFKLGDPQRLYVRLPNKGWRYSPCYVNVLRTRAIPLILLQAFLVLFVHGLKSKLRRIMISKLFWEDSKQPLLIKNLPYQPWRKSAFRSFIGIYFAVSRHFFDSWLGSSMVPLGGANSPSTPYWIVRSSISYFLMVSNASCFWVVQCTMMVRRKGGD